MLGGSRKTQPVVASGIVRHNILCFDVPSLLHSLEKTHYIVSFANFNWS